MASIVKVRESYGFAIYEALATIVSNASVIPDPTMNGSADCYRVPLEDIDRASDLIAKVRSVLDPVAA